MSRSNALWVCILSFTLTAGCDITGTSGNSSPPPRGASRLDDADGQAGDSRGTSEYDAAALQRIGQNSLGVVVISRLAAQNASNPSVKGFAARVQKAHNDLNVRMEQLGKSKGVQLARQLNDADNREVNRLKGLKGKDFDRAYVDAMVQNFTLIANIMHEEAKRGSDGDIRAFCANNEAAIRERNQAAKQFKAELAK